MGGPVCSFSRCSAPRSVPACPTQCMDGGGGGRDQKVLPKHTPFDPCAKSSRPTPKERSAGLRSLLGRANEETLDCFAASRHRKHRVFVVEAMAWHLAPTCMLSKHTGCTGVLYIGGQDLWLSTRNTHRSPGWTTQLSEQLRDREREREGGKEGIGKNWKPICSRTWYSQLRGQQNRYVIWLFKFETGLGEFCTNCHGLKIPHKPIEGGFFCR